MKILINIPSLKLNGGVSRFYEYLRPYWTETVKYNIIGRRDFVPLLNGFIWMPWDIIKFIYNIIFFNPDIVILSPSFVRPSVYRDSFFLRLSLFFNRKTIIFFHGWEAGYASELDKDISGRERLIRLLNRSFCLLVLASSFKQLFESWGIKVPVHIARTIVNDKLTDGFNIKDRSGKIETILFLARIEERKGVFIAIESYKILKEKYSKLKMRIVGDGYALHRAIKYVNDNKIKDIIFTGLLHGEDLRKQFLLSDIYLSPTYAGEGMPLAALEAIAFGLPVIIRPVGGLADFFKNGKMGDMIDSLDPMDFVDAVEKYILDVELTKRISKYNYVYAKEYFYASIVVKEFEKLFCS